jgi:hypothetical protein
VLVKQLMVWIAVLILALAGCKGREKATDGATETIAPAQPKPAATDSDAMTQTVDVEDGRSEADGGALNNPTTAKGDTAATETTATTENPTTTAAPPTTTTR